MLRIGFSPFVDLQGGSYIVFNQFREKYEAYRTTPQVARGRTTWERWC